jgi:hypothetical protein
MLHLKHPEMRMEKSECSCMTNTQNLDPVYVAADQSQYCGASPLSVHSGSCTLQYLPHSMGKRMVEVYRAYHVKDAGKAALQLMFAGFLNTGKNV